LGDLPTDEQGAVDKILNVVSCSGLGVPIGLAADPKLVARHLIPSYRARQ
jgi:hypothetical protein